MQSSRQHRLAFLPILLSLAMLLTGCMEEGSGGVSLATESTPERVVMQIINNSCGGESAETEAESTATGQVKGLAKVIDGFGVPYDEHADNFQFAPQPITDDSYEANKERGIGYAGIEDHYVGALAAGQEHSPDHPEHDDVGCAMFSDLTTKEEQYGCAMRWEYYNQDLSGPAIDGYMAFLRGNDSGHMQYLAVHATVSDKWVIVCPYDWGPALNLGTTGGGKYANGRLGGLSPAAAEALGIEGGDGPENAMTEWWWVENSDQVECGPVEDLSQFANGTTGSSSSSTATASQTHTTATITAAVTSRASSMLSGSQAVAIDPVNPNSFKQNMNPEYQHGGLPKDKVKYIVVQDTQKGSDDIDEYLRTMTAESVPHFIIGRNGEIAQCVPLNKIARHAGAGASGANESHGITQERDDEVGAPADADHAMDAWSVGIALVHKEDETSYPEAQMNALDKLVAYIDQELGSQAQIMRASTWQGRQEEQGVAQFPEEEYDSSRNHNDVKTADDAIQASAAGKCSDDVEEEEAVNGGESIAKMAVEISGTATPEEPIHGKWDEQPTDSRLAKYVERKNEAYPGVSGWADCGRCASTAVKASGADKTFPEGDTAAQYRYMSSSPKWKRVGTMRTGDSPDSQCEPGDVLVTEGKGHIMIYVGNDAVKKKYPTSDANFMEAVLDSYYGWCFSQTTSHSSCSYAIFRCVKSDNGGKKSGGAGDGDIIAWGETQIGITAYGQISFINPYIGENPEWADFAAERNAESYKEIAGTTDQNSASTDCFGFTFYCYTSAGYTDYPDHAWGGGGAKEMVEAAGNLTMDQNALQPGDLVFWENCPHIGIYYGEVDGVPSVIHNAHGVDIEPLETVNGYCGGFTGGGFPYDASMRHSEGTGKKSGGDKNPSSKSSGKSGAEVFVESCRNEFTAAQTTPCGWKFQEDLKKVGEQGQPGSSSYDWGGQCSEFCYWNLKNVGLVPGQHIPNTFDLCSVSYMQGFLEQHPEVGTWHNTLYEPDFVPQPGDLAGQEQGVHWEAVAEVGSDYWVTYSSGGPEISNPRRPINQGAGANKYDGFQVFVRFNWDNLPVQGASSSSDADDAGGDEDGERINVQVTRV